MNVRRNPEKKVNYLPLDLTKFCQVRVDAHGNIIECKPLDSDSLKRNWWHTRLGFDDYPVDFYSEHDGDWWYLASGRTTYLRKQWKTEGSARLFFRRWLATETAQ